MEENVKEAYRDICRKFGHKVAVAVRSSATTEDLENESFAGLHDTYLNIRGEDNVVEAVKRCLASFYTDRAVEYRRVNKFGQYGKQLKMGVVVQRMINPVVAGVAFSVDNSTAYDGVVIEVNYGLGESIVSGEVTPDRFVVHKQTLDIIKAQKGSKNKKVVYSKNSGTEIIEVPAEDRGKFCLDFGIVKKIANSVNKIQEAYSKRTRFVDTEFAIDEKGLFFLQARPATLDLRVITIEQEALKNSTKIYEGGTRATRMAGHGIIKIVPSFCDLKNGKIKVSFEDIVVTNHTWNEWTEYLRGIKGLVTEQGGTLSHAAIISKEWGIPGIAGCEGVVDTSRKYEGEKATIDANRRSLYLDYLPLVKKEINLDEESIEVKLENE